MRPVNQDEQARDAYLRQRPVADVLAGEGFLMHLRAHIAGINPVDTPLGVLCREDMRELLKRGLARAVAAPTFVCLNACIAGDVDNAGSWLDMVVKCLEERERGDHVGAVHLLKHIQRVLQQGRLRTWAEYTRVIDQ